ncbi:MAG: chromosome segregation protein SMC [Candidatus Aminicenantes bacterium]|nr:chromosome segregation protein SMC [Candidatus Aminicenantes bacterium]
MFIKRLELQGFKTFPDRTKILFNPGITIIIGPNGTGKSNIVEAIQWVLGGQRVRTVRGEKIDDAVFTGTAERPPMGMADVSLILQNSEDELVINHRVFRTGESEYRLDGKIVRLKDIQDELWKRAISENRYFVIEQGAIGTFVTSKPVEKRALIEEAAGTAFYKDKKRQAENKLEDSELNLTRLEDIIAEVSKAKNSLARQAGAAERYRRLRERVRELTSLHFRLKSFQLATGQGDVQTRHEEAAARERDQQARLGAEERTVNHKRKEVWDLEQSLKDGKEDLYSTLSQIARFDSERERETKRGEFLEETRRKSSSDADERLREILGLDEECARSREEEQTLSAVLAEKKDALESFEQVLAETAARISPLLQNTDALRSDHLQKLAEWTGARNDAAKIEKELELLRRQEEKLKIRETEARALVEAKAAGLREFESRRAAAMEETGTIRDCLTGLRGRLVETTRAIADLETRLQGLRDLRDVDAHHLQALEKIAVKERESDETTTVGGSLGLLAELVETDAADTNLIDVFWKDESRASVVRPEDFLRGLDDQTVKGRFLLLGETADNEDSRDLMGEPGVLGTLKARLRPGSRIPGGLPTLRDAVVVDDVRTAIRLWLRRPRLNFIAQNGDVLSASGLLALGPRKEGLFGLHQEIRDLGRALSLREGEIAPLARELEERRKERQDLEDQISNATVHLAELEKDLIQIDKDFSLAEAERAKLGEDIALFGHELEILAMDKTALREKMDAQTRLVDGLHEENNTLQAQWEAEERELVRHQERQNTESTRMATVQGEVNVLETKLQSLGNLLLGMTQRKEASQSKITALEAGIRSSMEEEDRIKTAVSEFAEKITDLQVQKGEREKILTADDARLITVRKDLEAAEESLGNLRTEHDRLKDERMAWEVRKAEIERDMVNLEEACWTELKKTLQEIKAEPMPEPEPGAPAPIITEVEAELENANEDLAKYKAVNLMAEEEYVQQKERYDFLVAQRNDLRTSISQTKEAITQINEESRDRFLSALTEINTNFQELFNVLFKGGAAEVRLVDEANPLDSGVEVIAQPPGKKLSNMGLLSGGEKSLTSLAFLFALFRFKPTPFCILDEIDAALDEPNLVRFLDLMKKIKSDTQFIIITHNYKTMEVADYIYGTTMEEPNVTRIFSMKLDKKPEAEAGA